MTKMLIFILSISLFSNIFAEDSITVNADGYCSSFATKSLEGLIKKAGVKECAKESALYLAIDLCREIGSKEVRNTKSKFVACEKNEFFEDDQKIVEYKCFYNATAKCLVEIK